MEKVHQRENAKKLCKKKRRRLQNEQKNAEILKEKAAPDTTGVYLRVRDNVCTDCASFEATKNYLFEAFAEEEGWETVNDIPECVVYHEMEEDRRQGNYNPLLLRYGQEMDDTALEDTMLHSLELAAAAVQLGRFGCRLPVLENILCLGLPLVQRAVFNGSWSQIKNQKIWRNDT